MSTIVEDPVKFIYNAIIQEEQAVDFIINSLQS